MNNKLFRIGLIAAVAIVTVTGAYFFAKRLVRDRTAAMMYEGRSAVHSANLPPTNTRTVKNYTAKDLEEARKNGNVPPDMKNSPTQSNAMNDAVQRNLRTLDEINRINQMNQRLMEQQESMRRQNKN